MPFIDWDNQPLGKVKDTVLAKRLGVSEVAVGKQRRKRGIPVYDSRRYGCRSPGQRAGINWDEQPLGEISDIKLARDLGVDPSSVRSARKVRNIAHITIEQNQPSVDPSTSKKVSSIPHGHKCPVCLDVFMCEEECEVDRDLFTSDGIVLGRYVTCKSCIDTLKKQKDRVPVYLSRTTINFQKV